MTIENMSVEALFACLFLGFSVISSARMLCGTNRHSITISPFEQIHNFGDLGGTTREERAAYQRVTRLLHPAIGFGSTHDSAASTRYIGNELRARLPDLFGHRLRRSFWLILLQLVQHIPDLVVQVGSGHALMLRDRVLEVGVVYVESDMKERNG